ncbi:MAG: BamA/TamA family outer membrane protein [Sediminibacterium sp.]
MHLTGKRLRTIRFLAFIILLCSIFTSCSKQNYPIGRPFVYDNKVILNGNLTKDEKKRLTNELDNYWDDSLKSRKVRQFFFFNRIKNPPVFDSNNVSRSISFMNAYLNSQGYYYATFRDSVKIDTVEDQFRANIKMDIEVGKNVTIDSVSYDLGDTTLQRLTKAQAAGSLLKKGDPYTKQVISQELDRLIRLYRQNGYYKFTTEDVFAEVDSTDSRLIALTLDPFQQAQIIADAAKRRKENPAWKIAILKKTTTDSSELIQFHIGKLYYYPETKLTDIPENLMEQKDFKEFVHREMTMRYQKGLFGYKPLREHTYVRRGDLYNENDYLKSITTMEQIGAWQQVDAKPVVRDKDSLDIYFFLVPSVKQSFAIDLEGSLNTADVISGNSLGLSTNLSYLNRNVWKQAIQSATTLRTGVEFNLLSRNSDHLVQAFLVNLGHTYAFPKLIQPFTNWRALRKPENKRTLVSMNGSYVDRRDYYQIRSLASSWGYEWKTRRGRGENIWLYKPLNVELYAINKLPRLDTLLQNNPFLKASFNEGNIVSQSLSVIRTVNSKKNQNKSHYMRLGVEEAGGLFGLIPGLKDNIYRYVKTEAEYRQSTKFPKAELAYRAFIGAGLNYGSDSVVGRTLPFFKQFTAGGPYSMRAWPLRQLGLGSSLKSDTISSSNYRDRFGDLQLEANIEYRFQLATIAGFKVGSALYADIGNIWNVKPSSVDPAAKFSFSNLGRDLAIGIGTGLRIDLNYLILRFDFAYKVKDPARQLHGGWMSIKDFEWTNTRQNGLKVNNYAFQFGIGLPF